MTTDAVLAPAWHALADPWSSSIMVRAFVEVGLLGVAGGALGCWVVFYGLSYSAESLAHSLFPGLVIAALLGLPLLLGGAVGIVAAALAVGVAARAPGVDRDTAVAVVVTGLFGLGALLALSPATPAGLSELLFGDILGLSDTDLALAGGLAVIVLVTLRLLHGRLLAVGFDRTSAPSLGISPGFIDAALLVLLALAVLVAVQGLGNLLVVAVLVGPAASARLLARRIVPMMVTAAALTILAGLGGLYLSYYVQTAAGASIAGLTVVLYLIAATASRVRSGAGAPDNLERGITIGA
ncbi:MAG: metal ABC transporter permease [Solirubrobacteraceae bacterium]